MLSTDELIAYFERNKLSAASINVIQRIRNSDPERRVSSGANNVACHYASKKMGFTIQAESHKNELAAVVGWEFDDRTYEIYDQPQKLKFSYIGKNGRTVSYQSTPDFFLLQEDFAGWVECKPEDELQKIAETGSKLFIKDEQGKWRCPAGEAAAAEFGLKFIVRSSAENNVTFLRNLDFLADYFDESCPPISESNVDAVYQAFSESAWSNLKSLIDAGLDVNVIYKMLADQRLYFDINTTLLAEPDRAILYRNKLAADAYKLHAASKISPVTSKSTTFEIKVGSMFMWDGVAWTILNHGDSKVFIENSEKITSSLSKDVLLQLAKDGVVAGIPEGISANHSFAEDALRKASPDEFQEALVRYQNIFPENESQITASARSISRWRTLYRESILLYGSGFVGLLPRSHKRGNRLRKLDVRVIEIMNDVIQELYLKPNGRSKTSCWGEIKLRCAEEGLVPPSEKSLAAELNRRSGNEVKALRNGAKAAYSSSEFIWYLDQSTPRHGDRPFEIGHIDHTQLDLQFVGSKYGENRGKAWLTVLLDAHTRTVLAWTITFDEPSYRSCMDVIRDCVRRHGRIPKYIVVDQGSEFLSVYFDCLLARLESHKKIRPGGKPRFGSVIERFFGINNQTFIHNLQGNNKPLQSPRSLSRSHDPRALAIWTLPQFREAFNGYIENVYSKLEHAALGVSPEVAMAVGLKHSGNRPHTVIPYTPEFVIMCLPSTQKGTAKVDPSRGVKIDYIYYWTPEFRNPKYANEQVPVRYDPYDKSRALVWLKDHWAECYSEYRAEFEGRTEKEINDATQELRARLKNESNRRSINAQLIAAYLRDITKTEQGLLTEQRKLESLTVSQIQIVDTAEPEGIAESSPRNGDMWVNLTTRVIGEFEL